MKVTVERAALFRSLGHVHRVVERRTTIPILSNILLQAELRNLPMAAARERAAALIEMAGLKGFEQK